jgi:DNA mismatch endonuclease (patch repair protein)
MVDKVDKKRRSEIMSSIRGQNTKPELIVRKYLFSKGFRYRLHDKSLPGKPDIKLTKYKCLVFINGCFWHGHKNCKIYVMPKSNIDF